MTRNSSEDITQPDGAAPSAEDLPDGSGSTGASKESDSEADTASGGAPE
ncbi:hypothetical protein [Subtercola sp. YIM 133946]